MLLEKTLFWFNHGGHAPLPLLFLDNDILSILGGFVALIIILAALTYVSVLSLSQRLKRSIEVEERSVNRESFIKSAYDERIRLYEETLKAKERLIEGQIREISQEDKRHQSLLHSITGVRAHLEEELVNTLNRAQLPAVLTYGARFAPTNLAFIQSTRQLIERLEQLNEGVPREDTLLGLNLELGNAFYFLFQYDKAISAYDKAISGERAVIAYNNRAVVYLEQENLGAALTSLDEAIALDPALGEAFNNRGILYRKRGDLSGAREDFTRAIRLSPTYAQAYNNRGIVFRRQANLPGAEADYNAAIRLSPRFAEAFYNRGIVYHLQGRWSEAVRDYTSAIELRPNYAEAFMNRGLVFKSLSQFDRALNDQRQAARLDQNEAIAYYNLACTLAVSGDLESTLKYLTISLGLDPQLATSARHEPDFADLATSTPFLQLISGASSFELMEIAGKDDFAGSREASLVVAADRLERSAGTDNYRFNLADLPDESISAPGWKSGQDDQNLLFEAPEMFNGNAPFAFFEQQPALVFDNSTAEPSSLRWNGHDQDNKKSLSA